jgi:aspartate dehydrogenase
MKVALIGCGFIGQTIAGAVKEGAVDATLVSVFSIKRESSERVAAMCKDAKIANSLSDVLESDAELVIEAASIDALKQYAVDILNSKKNLMAMSVGAFADKEFLEGIEKVARENGVKVYLPSGAVGGLDALKSAAVAPLSDVSIITTKPPKSLRGNQYLSDKGIDVDRITEKQVLYEGSAADAIEKFPSNVNTAVTVGLCGLGPEKTHITLVCDPEIDKNVHEIHAKGDFGEFRFRIENLPSPKNPRTSYIAALSAITTLKRITSHIETGT